MYVILYICRVNLWHVLILASILQCYIFNYICLHIYVQIYAHMSAVTYREKRESDSLDIELQGASIQGTEFRSSIRAARRLNLPQEEQQEGLST